MNNADSVFPDYNSPEVLKKILQTSGLEMKKKFGQNFLINHKIRNEIIALLDVNNGNKIWEIGAGLGAMTLPLLETGASVTVFEIDKGFISLLKYFFFQENRMRLIEGDVLNTWKNELAFSGLPDVFFGNLPYNIALKLLLDTIEHGAIFDTVVVTMQKEAVDRLTALPNKKNYTPISVFCNYFYTCEFIKIIPPSAFWPQPHVESAVILLKKNKERNRHKDITVFIKIVNALFSSRRKTVKNNLVNWLMCNGYTDKISFILNQIKFDINLRAENLTLYDFLAISDIIASLGKN